ncbi:O-antigen ligase family protein [Arthrobacter sp. NPDC055585]
MQLIGWIGACLLLAVFLRRRPAIAAFAVLALWFAVPAVGSYLLTGQNSGAVSFHAASWLVFAVFAVQVLSAPTVLGDAIARHIYAVVAWAMVMAAAAASTQLAGSGGGMVLLMDQILTPGLFFLYIVANAARHPEMIRQLRNGLLLLGALVCLVALAQVVSGKVLFYESGFSTRYWFKPERGRWMGTLDQPLALSLAACVIAPLVAGLRRTWLQAVLLGLLSAGVLASQSRVGLAVMVIVVLYVLLGRRRGFFSTVALGAVLAAFAAWVISSPLAAGVLARLEDDTGSAQARALAMDAFLREWPDFLFTGGGINSSYRLAEEVGLGTSLENSFLMYAVDFGIFFSAIYFGLLLVLATRSLRFTFTSGYAVAALLAIAIPQTYSALATRSVAAILLWTVVALAVAEGERRRTTAVPPQTAAERLRLWGVRTTTGPEADPARPAALAFNS